MDCSPLIYEIWFCQGGRKLAVNQLTNLPKQWVIVREQDGKGRHQLFRVSQPKIPLRRLFNKWADIIGESPESLAFYHHEAHLYNSDGLLNGDDTFEEKKIADGDGIDAYKWIPGTPPK